MSLSAKINTPRLLLSAYPLTRGIIESIKRGAPDKTTRSVCLGDLKRNSIADIFRTLRQMGRPDLELWVVVSDHNYQPYLQIMLLLASLVPAEKYSVVDFGGEKYVTSRWKIWAVAPWKLLLGTVRGLWSLGRAAFESMRLGKAPRLAGKALNGLPRVAYLKTNLWFGVQAGGSIGHVAGVVNGFSRLGCPVDVYTAEALPMLDDAVHVIEVPIRAASGLPLEINGYIFQRVFDHFVRPLSFKNTQADLVYQRNCLVNYSGVRLSRRLNVPLVIEYNGSEVWVSKNWGTPLRFSGVAQRIEEINLQHAHLIVVVSNVLKDELLERGIEQERILSYPNCIDPKIFDPGNFSAGQLRALRARWSVAEDALVSTFVGTFGPWHGVDVMAGAVRHLASYRLDWLRSHKVHFMFVGDGQLMPKVRDLLVGVPEDIYTFTGLVPQTDAPAYLAASDILLSPHVPNPDGSRFFGSPTKLFEYMAMSKPIIASELEQIGQVLQGSWHVGRQGVSPTEQELQGSAAILTTPGDISQFCGALEHLVEHAAHRKVLGDAARSLALAKYTWEGQVEALMDRLSKLEATTCA
jgi:glycosyltransferase involved in cell wall biosynthesis